MLSESDASASVKRWIETALPARLTLVFSGGEPTLWGYPSLDKICGLATELAERRGKDLTIGIQSNGTTIGERMIEWCRAWGIEPSFSLDGPAHLNDVKRGMGEKIVGGLHRLKAAGVSFGIITCLTSDIVEFMDPILEWYRENGFLKVRINTLGYAPPGRSDTYPGAAQIHAARCKIYFHMERYGSDGVREKNVLEAVEIFNSILYGKPWDKRHCAELRCGAGRQIAAVNPDGKWAACIEKSMTDGMPIAPSIEEMTSESDRYWENFPGWDVCRSCSAAPICDHGCPSYHKLDHALFKHECVANKMFWDFLVTRTIGGL
jgi:radical SAM protein with 4Fe4S-binding SPASM domain